MYTLYFYFYKHYDVLTIENAFSIITIQFPLYQFHPSPSYPLVFTTLFPVSMCSFLFGLVCSLEFLFVVYIQYIHEIIWYLPFSTDISFNIIPSRSIHVVINGKTASFYGWGVFQSTCVSGVEGCIYYIFIYSSIDGHLDFFYVLAVRSYSSSSFKFLRNLFLMLTVPIYIPTNSAKACPCLHILSKTCYFLLFDNSHSNRCEVITLGFFFFVFL